MCGMKNPHGLYAAFYELANGEVAALVTGREEHQSYPDRMHGGVSTALLDETIGRAIMTHYPGQEIWGVTVEFQTRFLKPVPLDVPLRVVGRIIGEEGRCFEGTGEILLPNGEVAASGVGKYVKLPLERIVNADAHSEMWQVVDEDDPVEIDLGTA